ncbi:MAG TPA: hypothetical protein VM223_28340 [Planctomycetota bacterium]|nr:hypothetical protein [Planctomycetota bacterium]
MPDAGVGNSDRVFFKRLTPEHAIPYAEEDRSSGGICYGTAYPLTERVWLCAYDAFSGTYNGVANNYGIYLMDAFGNRELLYRDPKISCMSPIPLRPTPVPPVIPDLSTPPATPVPEADAGNPPAGTVGVVNVYDSTLALPPDTPITELRIWEILPKTTPIKDRPRTRLGDNSGTRALLGSVPVEKDGSAYFTMPANVPVFFQAVDASGCCAQTMRSDTYIHAGERRLCLGCHEPRNRAPSLRTGFPAAFQREPSQITPDVDGTNPFNYVRLVQPVLDKHCVSCHFKDKTGKAPDLTKGDWQRHPNRFPNSVESLSAYLAKDIHNFNSHLGQLDRSTPGQFGARASKLYQILSDPRGHHGLKLPQEDLHRLIVWMDSSGSVWGSDREIDRQAAGEVVRPLAHPGNDTSVDANYAHASMHVSAATWTMELKDAHGFGRPTTDAIQPGTGFRVYGPPKKDSGQPVEYPFGKVENFPLVAYYAPEQELRLETSPIIAHKRATHLMLYQTLQNVGEKPSPPIDAVEPLHIGFGEAGKGWHHFSVGGERSGIRTVPMLVVLTGDDANTDGFFCFLEWPGPGGYVTFEGGVLRAGVNLGGMHLEPGETVVLPVVHTGFFIGGPAEAEIVLRRYLQDHTIFEKASARSRMILPDNILSEHAFARPVADGAILQSSLACGSTSAEAALLGRLAADPQLGIGDQPWSASSAKRLMHWLAELRSVQHLLRQDACSLLPDDHPVDAIEFVSYQADEAAVVAFADAEGGEAVLRLHGLRQEIEYEVVRRPTGQTTRANGANLMNEGLRVFFQPRESALWRVKVSGSSK